MCVLSQGKVFFLLGLSESLRATRLESRYAEVELEVLLKDKLTTLNQANDCLNLFRKDCSPSSSIRIHCLFSSGNFQVKSVTLANKMP